MRSRNCSRLRARLVSGRCRLVVVGSATRAHARTAAVNCLSSSARSSNEKSGLEWERKRARWRTVCAVVSTSASTPREIFSNRLNPSALYHCRSSKQSVVRRRRTKETKTLLDIYHPRVASFRASGLNGEFLRTNIRRATRHNPPNMFRASRVY